MPAPKKPAAAKPTATVSTGRTIDLDAARAARHEALGEPVTLKSNGISLTLPIEMPYAFARAGETGDMAGTEAAIGVLIGDAEKTTAFFSDPHLSLDDVKWFIDEANRIYGIDEGK